MSTKSSLAYGESFHLYHEMMDDDDVYLQLRGDNIEFEAWPHEITVRIPLHVWEHIRHYGGFVPQYHLLDDQALLELVTRKVDERIKAWEDSGKSDLSAFFGSLVYGLASEPREDQITQGFACLVARRAEEREIVQRIEALRKAEPLSADFVARMESLVKGVKVDIDEPIDGDVNINQGGGTLPGF